MLPTDWRAQKPVGTGPGEPGFQAGVRWATPHNKVRVMIHWPQQPEGSYVYPTWVLYTRWQAIRWAFMVIRCAVFKTWPEHYIETFGRDL